MTRQEIQALIDAKIKGQGTAVDAGSVLPAILTGILDLIEQGGGGGTADAVQYIPQELTEPQQMQARKNQGLYYEEAGTLAGVISWDGNTEGKESIDLGGMLAYKVANTPKDIPQDAWIGFTSTEQLETTPFTQIVDYGQMAGAEGKMLMGAASGGGVVIVADQFSIDAQGLTIEADGIYFTLNVRSFSYDAYEGEVYQIPAKYIPSTGLDVFEIKVSQDISYGEPIEVENVTFEDIMDACAAGKYIVLTIMADGAWGRCLGGNFSRMESTGDSIYGQPCYCFAGAYRKASSGSSGQFVSYSLKDVVLYEDANDGLLYVELQDCNG